MTNLLEVKNLTSGYGEKEVIRNISFSLTVGEFVGLVGPNGAGKSTCLRVLTRILPSWEGKINFRDKNLADYSMKELAQEIAFLPQNIETPFSYTGEEFILLGRYPHSGYWDRISPAEESLLEEIMQYTDTLSLKDKKINCLSGGEKQRIFLAQTLIQQPKLLLLDEPVAHLDIKHQIEILDLIKKQNREKGLTTIVVFHDLNLASEYCDNLILLNNGRIHQIGTPNEVLTYSNIEEVYQTIVVVKVNPLSSKPHILLIPQWSRK